MKALITGGAGFIGCNAVKRYLERGWDITIADDLSRRGSEKNLAWLQTLGKFSFHKCDIRDAKQVEGVFREHCGFERIRHFLYLGFRTRLQQSIEASVLARPAQRAQPVERARAGDREQPGAPARPAGLEPPCLPPRLPEHFFDHVVRLRGFMHDAHDHRADRALPSIVKAAERAFVAAAHAREKRGIIRRASLFTLF